MSILNKLMGQGSKKTSHVAITSIGKRKVEEMSAGGIKFDILSYLEDSGSCSVNELADATKSNEHKIRLALKNMIHDGWIKETSNESDE